MQGSTDQRFSDTIYYDTYSSFHQFFGLEFFHKVAKFVLQEVGLFRIFDFNVFL